MKLLVKGIPQFMWLLKRPSDGSLLSSKNIGTNNFLVSVYVLCINKLKIFVQIGIDSAGELLKMTDQILMISLFTFYGVRSLKYTDKFI